MRRFVVLLALIAAALIVPAAQADAPLIVPAPAVDFTDLADCAFPVAVHFTANGQTAKIFSDGTIIVTGPLAVTLSANGKSVSMNISGPATISPSGTVVGHGVGVGPTLLPNGEITLAYNAGNIVVSDYPAVVTRGHILLDVCAALAP